MIVGLGTDLVEIARIERAMANPRFRRRVLAPEERTDPMTAERLACRWAAKEAVAKALGRPVPWHDVRISNADSGAPLATTAPGTLPDGARLLISISHERTHAMAVAIIETGEF